VRAAAGQSRPHPVVIVSAGSDSALTGRLAATLRAVARLDSTLRVVAWPPSGRSAQIFVWKERRWRLPDPARYFCGASADDAPGDSTQLAISIYDLTTGAPVLVLGARVGRFGAEDVVDSLAESAWRNFGLRAPPEPAPVRRRHSPNHG